MEHIIVTRLPVKEIHFQRGKRHTNMARIHLPLSEKGLSSNSSGGIRGTAWPPGIMESRGFSATILAWQRRITLEVIGSESEGPVAIPHSHRQRDPPVFLGFEVPEP
jgi:hypothetical protein